MNPIRSSARRPPHHGHRSRSSVSQLTERSVQETIAPFDHGPSGSLYLLACAEICGRWQRRNELNNLLRLHDNRAGWSHSPRRGRSVEVEHPLPAKRSNRPDADPRPGAFGSTIQSKVAGWTTRRPTHHRKRQPLAKAAQARSRMVSTVWVWIQCRRQAGIGPPRKARRIGR